VIEMVFFDAGETILHPHPSFPELFARTCAEHGYTIEPERVRETQSRLGPHLIEIAADSGVEDASLSAEASKEFWTFLYRRLLSELGLDESLAGELYQVFSDSRSYKLFDDVKPALDRLEQAGYRIGLISNFEGWLEKMLVELEVGHVFEVSVISGVEGVEKPDPRIYEIALTKAAVSPANTVHVGDSVKFDVEPAKSVGMHAVLIDRAGTAGGEGCPTIMSLEELPGVISKL
jgi:putative hydrolase of the HAD superfamily